MSERQILFLFGSQMCVPEDPLRAAKELGCRTLVLAEESCCISSSALVDRFERVRIGNANEIVELARRLDQFDKIDGVVCYDDQAVPVAARICAALGLPGNPVSAADAGRDKFLMKRAFQRGGIPIARYTLSSDEEHAVRWAETSHYPVVVKPIRGSASQAVIRADSERDLRQAYRRALRIIRDYGIDLGGHSPSTLLVEEYLPGAEVSVELFLLNGNAQAICVFEKPQALEGPFFEETIYVTPERIGQVQSHEIRTLAVTACAALGLRVGPAHCEIRLTPTGLRVLEINARLIGGACSRVFRYILGEDIHKYVLSAALGESFDLPCQKNRMAAGAAMLPIAGEGVLTSIRGLDRARQVAGINDVIVTAQAGQTIVPFPDQSCYIGFLTASGLTAADVERSLRQALTQVSLEMTPLICQTFSRPLEKNRYQPPIESEIASLDTLSLSAARERATRLLAASQFSELPPALATSMAEECVQHLEGDASSRTNPGYWFISPERGIVLGAVREGSCMISCFGVLPGFRGTGIGKALVEALMRKFAGEGHTALRVIVDPRNPVATATYRHLGFTPEADCGTSCSACCPST